MTAALGTKAAARLLAARTGLPVAGADVRVLAARGRFRVTANFTDWPMYASEDVEAFDGVEELREVVAERIEWWGASTDRWDAAQALGVAPDQVQAVMARRGARPGRFGRYRRTDVAAVAQDRSFACDKEGSVVTDIVAGRPADEPLPGDSSWRTRVSSQLTARRRQ